MTGPTTAVSDHEMRVESRVANWWTIGTSALVVVIVTVLSIGGIVRGKRGDRTT